MRLKDCYNIPDMESLYFISEYLLVNVYLNNNKSQTAKVIRKLTEGHS